MTQCNHCTDESRCERMGICQAFRLLPRVEPLPARGWPADKDAEPVPLPKLPPAIVMHPQLGELFDRLAMHTYAMGYAMACANAPSPGQQWKCGDEDGVQGRVEALGAEIDQKLSKYDEPQTFSPELEAAADAALARLAGNAGVTAAPYQVVAPSDAGGGEDTP